MARALAGELVGDQFREGVGAVADFVFCRRFHFAESLAASCWQENRIVAKSALAARRPLRVGETWGCGRVVQTPRMEYTATAFAEPLRRMLRILLGA